MTVKVAKNLHKKQFSIRENGKVTGYEENLTLHHCHFEVNEKTRQRVIRKGHKEVHAFVVGDLTVHQNPPAHAILIGYNPHRCGQFYRKDTFATIQKAQSVHFTPQGVYAVDPQ